MPKLSPFPEGELPPGVPAGTMWFGGPVDSAQVTLRVFGKDVDPNEITRLFGCEPSSSARTGAVLNVNGHTRIVREGYWRLESERASTDIEEQIPLLLGRVTDDLGIWRSLTLRHRVDLFCGLFLDADNRGFDLSPSVLRQLADRELKVGFDIYAPESPSQAA